MNRSLRVKLRILNGEAMEELKYLFTYFTFQEPSTVDLVMTSGSLKVLVNSVPFGSTLKSFF